MNILQRLQSCFEHNRIYYSRHARNEMDVEEFGEIKEHEIFESVMSGEIIKEYPDDKPYPSILIFGQTKSFRPLHILSAYDKLDNIGIIITVYQPNPEIWVDYRRRIK